MLKTLKIQNIILAEQATIDFTLGLNILTGETGSGKSAIMHALSLAIGERADSSRIRRGSEKGTVEAVFEIDDAAILSLLEDSGIDHERGQELIIRREISQSGKGRIFINQQATQLAFLKKLGTALVQLVGQHSNQALLSLDYHRYAIDLFGNHHTLLHRFQESFELDRKLKSELDRLIKKESERFREIDLCLSELKEIEEAQMKEGEDDELFSEYTLLVNAEEMTTKLNDINQAFFGERFPLIALLNRQKSTLESLISFDSSLQSTLDSFQNSVIELQEIAYTIKNYQNRLSFEPQRIEKINERLGLLNRLKRKYGATFQEIFNYRQKASENLKKLENAEVEIEELKLQILQSEAQTNELAEQLSKKRTLAALQFEASLTSQIQSLNMVKATFTARIEKQSRTREGDDRVEFYLKPNVGEHEVSLREGVSGGEISRILLAIQSLLAGKEKIGTLIFDEVDANIGGETATIVGDKLKEISSSHQVICITHFPQVARLADCHLQISKEEREGRTIALVQELDAISRQVELTRMAGTGKFGRSRIEKS